MFFVILFLFKAKESYDLFAIRLNIYVVCALCSAFLYLVVLWAFVACVLSN